MTEDKTTTPLSDRPLTAEDVALLWEGDLLRDPDGLATFDSFVDGWIQTVGDKGVRMGFQPKHVTFIGRPDADGWIEWSGGENPVPGQEVDVLLRTGDVYIGCDLSDHATWKHVWGDGDIIAYRISRPTANVETGASEGEDLAGKLKAIRDKFLMATPDKDHTDYAVITRCIAALTPSPPVQLSERERALEGVLRQCRDLFSEIRGDWSDPRTECREGMAAIDAALTRTTGEG